MGLKKVLLVSGSLPPIRCGVGYYASRLSRELASTGLDFEILSTEGVDADTAAPLRVIPNWRIGSLPKMLAAIRASRAEIVHIQYPAVGYRRQLGINLLPYALRLFRPGLKIIVTLHEYHQSRFIGRLRNRFTIWPAHKIIVSNQPDKRMLGRPDRKVVIVPIGANFDTAPRRPEVFKRILKQHKLDPSARTIIFFGYAFPGKNLEALLAALDQPGLAEYQLLIFPDIDAKSDYHKMLRAKITTLNQSRPRVGVHGFLDEADASAVLQEGRYFVLPTSRPLSAKSGTAIAGIENGLTLISRAAQQPSDSLPFVHMKNSYLLDETNPAAIVEAITRLDAAPDELRVIQSGVKELKKYFSWPNIARQHLKVYEELDA
jgi:glycosyltransferase involved in cell wall biosynthesis